MDYKFLNSWSKLVDHKMTNKCHKIYKVSFTLCAYTFWLQQKVNDGLLAKLKAHCGIESVMTCRAFHCKHAFSVAVKFAGTVFKMVYSGDTRPTSELVQVRPLTPFHYVCLFMTLGVLLKRAKHQLAVFFVLEARSQTMLTTHWWVPCKGGRQQSNIGSQIGDRSLICLDDK